MARIDPPAFPPEPTFDDGGHVWIFAEPDGSPLAVRLTERGSLRLAVGTRASDRYPAFDRFDAADPPPAFGFAARHVRRRFDRRAVASAIADPERAVFRCWAVHRLTRATPRATIDSPPVVGWTVEHPEASVRPHELRRLFEEVGLATPRVVDREVPVSSLSLEEPPAVPEPAVGLRYKRKGGPWSRRVREPDEPASPVKPSVDAFAADALEAAAWSPADGRSSVDEITTRLLDQTVRARFPAVTHDRTEFDCSELRSAIATRVAEQVGRS